MSSGQGDDGAVGEGAPAELPGIDFATFILSLAHSALVHMGDAPDPSGASPLNVELARQTIDLLSMLEEKTRGNLSGQEERLLSQWLYDLRVRFVEVAGRK